MANEIIALEGSKEGNSYNLLMIFPLDSGKIKQVGGNNVVPTPSSGLTTLEDLLLDAGHKAALDAGTSVYRRVTLAILETDNGASLTSKAVSRYTALAAEVQEAYDKIYKFSGAKLDAPS